MREGKGTCTTACTPALSIWPSVSAPIAQRLLNACAIVMGRPNMHELAQGVTSNNAYTGPVRNPYGRERSPGGSSGGTAAAVALGLVPGGIDSCAASASIGSSCLGWFCQKRLIRLARALDHSRRKISFSELWDLLIFLGLGTMGIDALKIRVDFAFSRGGGENDVVLVHLLYAWKSCA